MKRFTLALLAMISLLFGVSAATGSQMKSVQADTIPLYGCPAILDGSPVGGGVGYLNIISQSQADYVVSTAAKLKSALAVATSGQIVYVADGAAITLGSTSQMYSSGVGFYVPAGVTLAGGRGRTTTPGRIQRASGFQESSWYYLIKCGAGAKVCGLELYGNQDTTDRGHNWTGIKCGRPTEVYNCEIHGFGYCGVDITPDIVDVWIHHNFIHHCRQTGNGYGVEVAAVSLNPDFNRQFHTASAIVEGNVFDYCRHTVANQGGRGSYTFRYNYLEANASYESQCDVHGQNDEPDEGHGIDPLEKIGDDWVYCAGDMVEIYNNTTVHYDGDWFVGVRGFPYGKVSVHHNWLKYPQASGADIIQMMFRMPEYGYNVTEGGAFINMESHDNWFGTTAPPSKNVAPVLNAIGNKSISESVALSFTISASDANGDALTYSASNLPVGAAFHPATRTFTWTPSQSQVGVYTGVRFQVSDGQMTDYEDITITVSNRVQADVNGDGSVNTLDMILVGQHWKETGESGWIPEDINRDGTVNVLDATLVGQGWTG